MMSWQTDRQMTDTAWQHIPHYAATCDDTTATRRCRTAVSSRSYALCDAVTLTFDLLTEYSLVGELSWWTDYPCAKFGHCTFSHFGFIALNTLLNILTLWPWTLTFWPSIHCWVRYRDGLSLCQIWQFWFKPFWFYCADRQTDRITDVDERYTDATIVGVSITTQFGSIVTLVRK